MYKDKAYVCNRCRKVITYALTQKGTTIPCPFCSTPVNLPAGKDFQSELGTRKKGVPLLYLSLIVAFAGTGAYLFITPNTPAANTSQILSAWTAKLYDHIVVAPEPMRVRGARATVAVTEVRFVCPDIIHPEQSRNLSHTETPACCVTLLISNIGRETVCFRSWRIFEALTDNGNAILTDQDGHPHSLVSYGIGTYPKGSRQRADLGPEETITEQVLFSFAEKPATDLELSLPSKNLGGKGFLRFRIPHSMIQ